MAGIQPGPGEGKDPQDRNEFAIGPFRETLEESQVKQKAESAYGQTGEETVTEEELGDDRTYAWASGYWYTTDAYSNTGVSTSSNNGGNAVFPFPVMDSVALSSIGIYVSDNNGSPTNTYQMSIGLYDDQGGFPGNLLGGVTFNYGDTSLAIGFNEIPLPAPITVSPGRYWIFVRVFSSSVGAGAAYVRTRTFTANSGPLTQTQLSTLGANYHGQSAAYLVTLPTGVTPVLPVYLGETLLGSIAARSVDVWFKVA